MMKVTEIKDGDVTTCKRCGDLIVMQGTEEAKKEFKKFNPGASFTDKEIALICDECWTEHLIISTQCN